MTPLQVHPLALEEFVRDAQYYEPQRRGVGIRFSEKVYAAFDRILAAPTSMLSALLGSRLRIVDAT